MRSRISGMRMAVAFGVSSLAVWALGPVVKAAGFDALLLAMAAIAVGTGIALAFLPSQRIADSGEGAAVAARVAGDARAGD
jgi:hypothetical protein